jgi:regulatory protein YycI of two-component signal transduction system YycFG
MKIDKQTILIFLLSLLLIGLFIQNRNLNQRLTAIEQKVTEANEHAAAAEDFSLKALQQAFGNVCNQCPEDVSR